jgi:dTDP-4-dehydrorhamnose reductase
LTSRIDVGETNVKAIVTGANGTVGKVLTAVLERQGVQVVPWDRARIPIDAYQPMENFVREQKPDVLFHLAIASQSTGRENESWYVNYEWSSELAWITRVLQIPFIFASTVLVFTDQARGPFHPDSQPNATEGYGGQKRRAEERVRYQNPASRIVRLGWQIGDAPGSNNMIDFFHQRMAHDGEIRASTEWYPSCSFLADTADGLLQVLNKEPGTYQLNSNHRWNFHQIAQALNRRHGHPWKVTLTRDFVHDQRMEDDRLTIGRLEERLSELNG